LEQAAKREEYNMMRMIIKRIIFLYLLFSVLSENYFDVIPAKAGIQASITGWIPAGACSERSRRTGMTALWKQPLPRE
jgi:hypothetical protein